VTTTVCRHCNVSPDPTTGNCPECGEDVSAHKADQFVDDLLLAAKAAEVALNAERAAFEAEVEQTLRDRTADVHVSPDLGIRLATSLDALEDDTREVELANLRETVDRAVETRTMRDLQEGKLVDEAAIQRGRDRAMTLINDTQPDPIADAAAEVEVANWDLPAPSEGVRDRFLEGIRVDPNDDGLDDDDETGDGS